MISSTAKGSKYLIVESIKGFPSYIRNSVEVVACFEQSGDAIAAARKFHSALSKKEKERRSFTIYKEVYSVDERGISEPYN